MKKDNAISELTLALGSLNGLQMLLHVGLRRDSVKGKIDMLAGCNGGDIHTYALLIESLLKNRWPTGNFYICDDSLRFNLSIATGGVAVRDSTMLLRQVEGWIEGKDLGGQHRQWAIGYWLPEALCGDIASAEILFDTEKIGARIKKLLSTYPPCLSERVIGFCLDEIKQKVQILEGLLERDAPIELGLCVSDISASMTRLAFARSKVYFRGFRSLDNQVRLLRPSDLVLYDLALNLSQKKDLANLRNKIDRLL